MSYKSLNLRFSTILASAIKSDRQDVIDYMFLQSKSEGRLFDIDFGAGFMAAATTGRVELVNKILDTCIASSSDIYVYTEYDAHINKSTFWCRIRPEIGLMLAQHIQSSLVTFRKDGLFDLLASVGQDNSLMTEEVFIECGNAILNTTDDNLIVELIQLAASLSLYHLKLLHQHILIIDELDMIDYSIAIFNCKSIKDSECIQYMIDVAGSASIQFANSFSDLTFGNVNNLRILIDNGYIDVRRNHALLLQVVELACSKGQADIVQYILQGIKTNGHWTFAPSLDAILLAARENHVNVLTVLFGDLSSPLRTIMEQVHLIRLLKLISNEAYTHGGLLKVVSLCDVILGQISDK
ncbi:hypothetical protein SAMD00019534_018030 [Acytostelium subglobosum LB1]|uniref:hypothetical protein n=1 Tax=Acytostelium subglobosum LB1 TaxID=1410327 RepID=UPI0006448E9D|nr:hypothetical protein SAMD00019534_018030 [Acytostelium subglobosum LB1]GAM18628.1 hypothetical protein SAMD00019534_018030 [Acytostelium subglobosum LB1]|eukprot:XP_012757848.1 hypothetical protein SAMD00019534_018030 [Acytostelium subglobosum LB1]